MSRTLKEKELNSLARTIIDCTRCRRLREYCELVGKTKRRAFLDWKYWSRPLPGFGDPNGRLLIVGLAPAANGGTRTGRLFCGDSSGDWLVKALYETGFANQPTSTSIDDGLLLTDAYLTAVVRCAPPENKPTPEEIVNCLSYLGQELDMLRKVRAVLVLGQIAFNGYLKALAGKSVLNHGNIKPEFRHGAVYVFEKSPKLFVSYHPSRRNTQTKMLTWEMWIEQFRNIRQFLDEAIPKAR